MDVGQIEGDGLQGQIDLPGHQIQVVEVGRQPQIGIAAALVGRQDQFPAVYLELHEAQAGGLVGLHVGGTEE